MIRMVDVSGKPISLRVATAHARIVLLQSTLEAIRDKRVPKGDVLDAATIAAINAAKTTHLILPLCHNVPIEHVDVGFNISNTDSIPPGNVETPPRGYIDVTVSVRGHARTGYEMEALTAASAAALCIYDFCKQIDKTAYIAEVKLLSKSKQIQ